MNKVNVLILDGKSEVRDGLNGFLSEEDFYIHQASEIREAFQILDENNIDIAVVGSDPKDGYPQNTLKTLKGKYPDLETVSLGGNFLGEISKTYQAGTSEYLKKPNKWLELQKSIEGTRSFSTYKKRQELLNVNFLHFSKELRDRQGHNIVGISSSIKTITSLILLVAKSEDTSVLITGESGTGKELVARAIHTISNRSKHPFCAVNCSAIPDSLFESEFFGYRKGAFTGAVEKSMGWFELSNQGTLFLDEITELPVSLQSKFLRVLDDKIINKIGSHQEIRLNLRVTAATNQDINVLLDNSTFREDLYHRLNSFHIHVPPLRERKEDIPVLLDHFIGTIAAKLNKVIHGIDKSAIEMLMDYSFPGNVRELKNVVERAVILTQNGMISESQIHIENHPSSLNRQAVEMPSRVFNLQEIEKNTILGALKQAEFNKTKAAKLLSISRQALDRKLIKFNIPSTGS
jgi:DNA-binding NtrC family response regulator